MKLTASPQKALALSAFTALIFALNISACGPGDKPLRGIPTKSSAPLLKSTANNKITSNSLDDFWKEKLASESELLTTDNPKIAGQWTLSHVYAKEQNSLGETQRIFDQAFDANGSTNGSRSEGSSDVDFISTYQNNRDFPGSQITAPYNLNISEQGLTNSDENLSLQLELTKNSIASNSNDIPGDWLADINLMTPLKITKTTEFMELKAADITSPSSSSLDRIELALRLNNDQLIIEVIQFFKNETKKTSTNETSLEVQPPQAFGLVYTRKAVKAEDVNLNAPNPAVDPTEGTVGHEGHDH